MKRKPVLSKTREIGATEFKAKCLAILDEVHDRTRDEVIITKRGKPWAKIVPVRGDIPDIYGFLKGTVVIHGDLTEPLDVEWDCLKE